MDPKALKKLAAACRKAGIKSFKGHGVEFTLTDEDPAPKVHKNSRPEPSYESVAAEFQADTLTEEQLLMWSTGASPDETEASS